MGSTTSTWVSIFSISVETKKKETKPEMEFRFCLILSLCLMANGVPKKTKTGAKLRASDNFETKMERLDSMEVKQKRMKLDSARAPFPVRLINNGVVNVKSGLLEIFVNGAWGTVCNDYGDGSDQHDNNVALVVCRMLGLSGGRTINLGGDQFGWLEGEPILVENLQCSGDEIDVSECRMTWFEKGSTNCVHGEDIGIECDLDIRV